MAIYPTNTGQYSAVYGRQRRFPYRAFIEAQIPRLYQSKQRMEDKATTEKGFALEEKGLDLETQALKENKRASEASLSESIRTSNIQTGLQREQAAEAKKQARVGTAMSGAQTGILGAYVGSKLLAAKGPGSLFAAGAQGAATGATGLGAGGASAVSAYPTLAGTSPLYAGAAGGPAEASAGAAGIGSALFTPAAGASLAPATAALGTAGVEMIHQGITKPLAVKTAGSLPGGEKEWKASEKIATRAGQGALIGSAVPGVGTGIGAGVGATVGVVESVVKAFSGGM